MATKTAATKTKKAAKAQNKQKASAKTAATPTKKAATKTRSTEFKKPTAREVMAKVNASMKAPVIRMAGDTSSSYLLRRPTGIISLDIALAGGFPASAPSVLCGPDGAGKDYILWRTMAEVQRLYGESFAAAVYLTEFKADKFFMKDVCGLQIAFTKAELDEFDEARTSMGHPPLTEEQRAHYMHQVGDIMLIQGEVAEVAFDALNDCLSSNAFQILAVNSIGFLQTEAKEKTDSFEEFAQRSSEAALLTKVVPKFSMLLNRLDESGAQNETSILLVNQMRAKQDIRKMPGRTLQERDKYRPATQSWALKHGKAIELTLHKGKDYKEEGTNRKMGREVPWEITKGKLGTHDGIRGSFDFFYDFGADVEGDLLNTALQLEVLEASGAWITYDHPTMNFKAQGRPEARKLLKSNTDLVDAVRRDCLRAADVVYKHR